MFVDNVNNHIQHALALAFDAGFKMPELFFKNNLTDEQIERLESDYHWEFIDNTVIFRPDGTEVSYVMFWNGEKFICHTIFINDKALMNDSQGGDIPANCVTCFPGKLSINKQLTKISSELAEREKNWKGFITLDLILTGGNIIYRDIRFSLLEDYLFCLATLNKSGIEELIEKLESGETLPKPEGFACSMRLYTYPYDPFENKQAAAAAYPFISAAYEGTESFILTHRGERIKDTWKDLLSQIPKHAAKYNLCYRTDGDKKARQAYNTLMREHYL